MEERVCGDSWVKRGQLLGTQRTSFNLPLPQSFSHMPSFQRPLPGRKPPLLLLLLCLNMEPSRNVTSSVEEASVIFGIVQYLLLLLLIRIPPVEFNDLFRSVLENTGDPSALL